MAIIQVNDVQLYYEVNGAGSWVMQVPGAVSGHAGYAAVTPAMAENFKVLDYDPRGYGASDRPKQDYTFDVWAADMVGLLDSLGIEQTHVHGGSMGSTLGLYFAARYPDRVRGLVLSGCTAKSDFMARAQYEVWKALARAYGMASRELAYELASKAVNRYMLEGPDGGEDLVDAIQDLAGTFVDVDVFCDACDALITVDVTDEIANVNAPTLVIVGDVDMLTPAIQGNTGAGGRQIYERLTAAAFTEYVTIEGSGHANLMDSPDQCLAAIVPFLQRVDAELGA
ncbi:MAG: alpha/beta fold hydrolase [Acidobacteria bacterium]|nr:alpha/beta fold hydrolase [Acidobacteriota bacterium]MCH8898894.1 alpha/beta fold hydrolase [Acidobacteriota bacterium]